MQPILAKFLFWIALWLFWLKMGQTLAADECATCDFWEVPWVSLSVERDTNTALIGFCKDKWNNVRKQLYVCTTTQ